MKDKFSKIILVIVLTMFGIVSVNAESRTKCTYNVSDKKFDLIISDNGSYSVQYTKSDFESVTTGENNPISNYRSGTCPYLVYKYENTNSLIVYTQGSNCSGVCYTVSPSSNEIIDYSPVTPPDSNENSQLDCSYVLSDDNVLTLNFINRNLTNYSMINNSKGRLMVLPNSSKKIYYDSCNKSVNYYIANNTGTICFALSGTGKCNENDQFDSWYSASLARTTNYDENGKPKYEYENDFNYEIIDNGGSMTCEELLGGKDSKGVKLLRTAFLLIKIAAPIIFIALSTVDFAGALMSDNPEGERNHAFRKMIIRAVACILLYMLPYLVKVIFALIGVIDTDTCGIW